MLAGLEGSVTRFRRLMTPAWQQEVKEYRYPEAHVALLTDIPFTVERQVLTLENRRSTNIIMLTKRLNETDSVGISFYDYGAILADPNGAVIRVARKALTRIGAIPSTIVSTPWRDRRSALGKGSANTSEGTIYASVRVVEMPEHLGSLVFLAATPTSKLEAGLLREQLERSTQLLR